MPAENNTLSSKKRNDSQKKNRDSAWKRSDQILEKKIAETSSQIFRFDIIGSLLALGTVTLLLLFGGILLDHLFLDGLSLKFRIIYLLAAGIVLFSFALFRFIPCIRYRINRLYSAESLEKSSGSLKNSLINWSLLNQKAGFETGFSASPDRHFLRKLSIKTADIIESSYENPIEPWIDTRPILRWGILFILSVLLLACYTLTSRKSPFVSAARILLPAIQINAPQSVEFRHIEPGNKALYFGKRIQIKAEISGAGDEPVFLSFSTIDGRITDQRLEMEMTSLNIYEIPFPAADTGLTEPLDYRIIVGALGREKGISPVFRLDVKPALTFLPIRISYEYPSYTKLPPSSTENEGNIEGPEGTAVTVTAETNYPMQHPLFVPDFTVSRAKTMKIIDANRAEWSFKLKTQEEGGEGHTYQLYTSDDNEEEKNYNISDPNNPENETPRWRIDSIPDPPPVIKWKNLPENLTLPENQSLTLSLNAEDPQYGLTSVTVEYSLVEVQGGKKTNREIPSLDLTEQIQASPSNKTFSGEIVIVPYKMGLKEGDSVECRAAAVDNRNPNPNRTESEPFIFTITKKELNLPQNEDGQKEEAQSEQNSESKEGEGNSGQSESGGNESGEEVSGEGSEEKEGAGAGESQEGEGESEDGGEETRSEGEESRSGSSEGGSEETQDGTGEGESDEGDSDIQDSKKAENTEQMGTGQSNDEEGTSEQKSNYQEGDGTSGIAGQEQDPNKGGEEDASPNRKNGVEPENNGEETNSGPIDSENDPGSAFEAIFDFAGLDIETAETVNSPEGIGTGADSEGEKNSAGRNDDSEDLRSGKGAPPPDAPRQTETNPGEIPEGANRENGKVDPDTSTYMATSGKNQESGGTPPQTGDIQIDPDLSANSAEDTGSGKNSEADLPQNNSHNGSEGEGSSSDSRDETPRDGKGSSEGEPAAGSDSDIPSDSSIDLPSSQVPKGSEDGTPLPQKERGGSENHSSAEKIQSGGGIGEESGTNINEQVTADRANREYSEKVTSLVLTYLDEQTQRGIDPKLLNRLGWTENELRAFHRRWKEMQDQTGTAEERRQYEEALYDMGIRPPQRELRRGPSEGDRTDSGTRGNRRSQPPESYRERFRLYNDEISKNSIVPSGHGIRAMER